VALVRVTASIRANSAHHGYLATRMAELLPSISQLRSFIAQLGVVMPKLLPFISFPRPLIAERPVFVGHLDPREPQLLPLMGEEHLSLAVLALHIADCFVLLGDEQLRMREPRAFIEHRGHAIAHEDAESAHESHFLRHGRDSLADRAESLGHADTKLTVVHSRQAAESGKLARPGARQADACAELPSP
jgi:hypothetical protein